MRIASYNIHYGTKTDALVHNIRSLASQGTAVFCLQEFWKWMQPVDLEEALLDALGPDWQMEYETAPRPQHDFGQCILWNTTVLQALSFERLTLPPLPKAKMWEKFWIRFTGSGPEAFVVKRGALVGTFRWGDFHLRVANAHLDWQGGTAQRISQVVYVRDYLAAHPDADGDIICGDFNSIGVFDKTRQVEVFEKILDEFENASSTPLMTCPPFTLDYLFVKNLWATDFRVHALRGSNHFPISAEIAPKT